MGRASYTQQLLDKAQAYVEQPLTARRYEDGMATITALYSEITGEAVGTCMQCQYSDFMAVVNNYIREATRFLHPELMPDSKYTFAPQFANEQIADGRYSKVVTAETLTDKDAEALIKLGYGHVIVLKSGAEAGEPAGDDKAGANETETKAKEALKTEKAAHSETKKELTATKKELVATATKLADAEKTVAELQAKLQPAPTDVVTGGEAQ